MKNPHDIFFKKAFKNLSIARSFLERVIPANQLKQLDLTSLELSPDSFVDDDLREFFADLVYVCKGRDGEGEYFISILIEHKSYIDRYLVFQVLHYIASYFLSLVRNRREPIPMIPIILCHAKSPIENVDILNQFKQYPNFIHSYVPKYDCIICDLGTLDDEEMQKFKSQFLVASLLSFKYSGSTEDLIRMFRVMVDYLSRSEEKHLLKSFFIYYSEIVDIPKENIINLYATVPKNIKTIALSTYDRIYQSGVEDGIVTGEKRGERRGEKRGFQIALRKAAINLIKEGLPTESICRILEVKPEFVNEIRVDLD